MKRRIVVTAGWSGDPQKPIAISIVFEDGADVEHVSHFLSTEAGWCALGDVLLDGMKSRPDSKLEVKRFGFNPSMLASVDFETTEAS